MQMPTLEKRAPLIPFRYILQFGQKIKRNDVIEVDTVPMIVRTIDKIEVDARGYVIMIGKGRELEC